MTWLAVLLLRVTIIRCIFFFVEWMVELKVLKHSYLLFFFCKMWQFLQQNLKFVSNIGNFGLILQKTHRNKHIFILMKCLTKKNRTNIIKTGVALFSFGCFFPFVFFIHHQNCSSLLLSNIFSSFWIRNSMNHIIYYQNGAYFCLVQFYNIIATIFKWIMYTWIVQMR